MLVARHFGPAPPSGQSWSWPAWTWLTSILPSWSWLVERYPGWLNRLGEPGSALAHFDILVCISGGLREGGQQLAAWSLEPEAASNYARRLHNDTRLRAQAAAAVGTDLATFDARAPEILADGFGMFPSVRDAANLLRTGNIH